MSFDVIPVSINSLHKIGSYWDFNLEKNRTAKTCIILCKKEPQRPNHRSSNFKINSKIIESRIVSNIHPQGRRAKSSAANLPPIPHETPYIIRQKKWRLSSSLYLKMEGHLILPNVRTTDKYCTRIIEVSMGGSYL